MKIILTMGGELQYPDDYNGFLDFMENLRNCFPSSFLVFRDQKLIVQGFS